MIVLDYCSFFFCLPSVSLGEFAEVFKGLYDGSTVAVKILKVRYNKSFVGSGGGGTNTSNSFENSPFRGWFPVVFRQSA